MKNSQIAQTVKMAGSVIAMACLVVLAGATTGCNGNDFTSSGVSVSAKYLKINKADNFSKSSTSALFDQIASDINTRAQDHIINSNDPNARPDARKVTIFYQAQDSSIYARTDCNFTDNTCEIFLNSNILHMDLDKATSKDDSLQSYRLLSSVLRHEIGHAFGLGHINNDADIMNWTVTNQNMPADDHINGSGFESSLHNYINDVNSFRIEGLASGLASSYVPPT